MIHVQGKVESTLNNMAGRTHARCNVELQDAKSLEPTPQARQQARALLVRPRTLPVSGSGPFPQSRE